MTNPEERWERARALFDAARALSADERARFLDGACPDTALREEVDALLRAHAALESGTGAGFLDRLQPDRTAALLASTEPGSIAGDDLAMGSTFGRYRILRPIGQGGMGVVYLAEDVRLERHAALKVLPHHLSVDSTARRRFEEEARAASALDHPAIVTVYDIGDAPDGRVYIAMAYCEGATLRDVLERGPLPVSEAVTLARQVAEGLAAAHRRGIVHRDIKPRNIIVTHDGEAKIVDFGIAKVAGSALTHTTSTPGTVAYMSPEQTRGGVTAPQADVWALGAVVYEMLTGTRPFVAEHEQALIYAIRNDEPEPLSRLRPDAPEALSEIVQRCLSKDPAARYADAGAVLAALRSVPTEVATPRSRTAEASGREALAPQALPPEQPVHPRRKRAAPFSERARIPAVRALAGAAAVAAIAIAIAVANRSSGQPHLEPRRVAVASMDNLTGAVQHELVARMAADWIIQGLWETGFIEVVPLAASGIGDAPAADRPARVSANEAGARLLVAGAVYLDGDVLRLQAHITDVANGRIVGSIEPVDAPVTAPMTGVEELRRRVQGALYPQLDTQLTHVRAVQRPPLFEAYSAYLAGRTAHVARDLPGALQHFQRAARLDSTFVLPQVIGALVMNMMGNQASADSVIRQLERAPERLDRFSRAHVTWLRGRLSGNRQASYAGMREAARFAPGSTLINYQLADETVRLGRPAEAIELLNSIEPERGELNGWFGYWQVLTTAHHLRGNHRRELEEARRARELYPDDPRAAFVELQALAALGRTREIEQVLDRTVVPPGRGEPSMGALMLHTALELRAHASARRSGTRLALADSLLARAIAWYQSRPEPEQNGRTRYELTMALSAAGRRGDARHLLAELTAAPGSGRVGPSPFAPRASPNYPDEIAYHGAAGVLAARDGDAQAVAAARSWLEAYRQPYARGRPTYWRAAILAAEGEREHAVAVMREAFAEGVAYSLALHAAPELLALRDFPPFQALIRARE